MSYGQASGNCPSLRLYAGLYKSTDSYLEDTTHYISLWSATISYTTSKMHSKIAVVISMGLIMTVFPVEGSGKWSGNWGQGWNQGQVAQLSRFQYNLLRFRFARVIRENIELLPRLVQLAFHDCIGGCDGCLNIEDPNNSNLDTTLALAEKLRADWAPQLSQADINVFVSIEALAFTARKAHGRVKVPFSIGRKDCDRSQGFPQRTFAHGRGLDSLQFLSRNFGTSIRESVALIGVHTLGKCSASVSGFRGPWDDSEHKLDNEYFKNMIESGWFIEQRDVLPIVRSSQWSKNDQAQSMMLHADMIIFKNFTTSGEFDTPNCEFDDCPLSDTAGMVYQFARNQRKFHKTLEEAFRKMVDGNGRGLTRV